jgi:hypothetical protein
MAREFKNPYYADNSKKVVVVEIIEEDGSSITASVGNTPKGEKDNPDWKEIHRRYELEEIDKNTLAIAKIDKANIAVEMAKRKSLEDKAKNEALFAAKVDAFEIKEISESKNRTLKAKIRKATNMLEISAYAAAIVIESLNAPDKKT